ncbi:MAG TPA: tetratricopeptide repeat protein [Blastocatellia bacterium]|nr:tetratricopeptide repeat protein [Blastocatellia bacterium]
MAGIYQFGPFLIDSAKRLLLRDGEAVSLSPKAFDTLLVLVQHQGEVLEKDRLMELIWPDSQVEEANLALHISALRKALGESPSEKRFIVTVPGRGYRFQAEVSEAGNGNEDYDLVVGRYQRRTVTIEQDELPTAPEPAALPIFPAPLAQANWRKRGLAGLIALVVIAGLVIGLRGWLGKGSVGPHPNARLTSLAVVPFKQLGPAGDDYLGVGIADSLITRLSNLHEIKVRPTSSVLKYSDTSAPPSQIGRELSVESVLEGTIMRAGESVRVTIQLIRVDDGAPVWAQQFDDKFTSIFSIEDSIADKIADSLAVKLTGEERGALTRRYTGSNEAYQLYLKGRYQFNKRTPDTIHQAIEFFRQATQTDPSYALAFTGLSDAYATLPITSDAPPKEAFSKAKEAVTQALKLDDGLAEAHTSAGYIEFYSDWDWKTAEDHLKRAIQINPNYPLAHFYYAVLLSCAGRFAEALPEANRALELDPVSVSFIALTGQFQYEAGQYDQAIQQVQRAFAIEPNFWIAHIVLGKVYIQKRMSAEAIEELQKALKYSGGNTEAIALMGFTYALSGDGAQAEKQIDDLKEMAKQRYVPASNIAMIYTGLGDRATALDWLEKAYNDRDVHVALIKVVPNWDSLRHEPRFIALVDRLGSGK